MESILTSIKKIASSIPQNHKIPNRLPLLGSIKLLIDKPVKTKCFLAYRTIKLQVSKPLLKCSQQGKFGGKHTYINQENARNHRRIRAL